MAEWYSKIGFDGDPFSRDSGFEGHDELVDEVFYAIHSGNMVFIIGESGSGKTKILHEVIKRFGGKKRIIYLNCRHMQHEVNVEKVLQGRYGFFGKLFGIKPQNMILLLDEVEQLSPKNCERIKYYFDQNHLSSVIFTGKEFSAETMSPSIAQRISKVMKISPLSDYEAVRIIRDKIGDKFLSDRVIKSLYQLSGRNTGRLIQNCKTVMLEMAENKKDDISEEDLQKILSVDEQ
ncbi:MAG: AAA family ATPase [Nanoarchaeota archaeon]|nr:AAA family ATPase [Nanoarchaeota archaeon]